MYVFYVLMVELQKGVQYVRPHVLSTMFVSNGQGSFCLSRVGLTIAGHSDRGL